MLTNSYYQEIEPLLLKHFNDKDVVNAWLFCPNHLFGYFSPISLVLTGDIRPLNWVKRQLEIKTNNAR